ncbi:hypothetical protein [Cryptosporangium arvum]|uniref:hypothetical protein n=1 Tax=Cryptosporangium arvum TaxID=80871 RepID=UPI00055BBC0B|nr:hypothetical protein [Cryptosporangium arvum]
MSDDVVDALQQFVARIDAFDPGAPVRTELDLGGRRLTLREPVVRALVEALHAYRDPRDNGQCDHCGSHRMDANFRCADCGRLSGLFGELITQRAADHIDPPELETSWTSS